MGVLGSGIEIRIHVRFGADQSFQTYDWAGRRGERKLFTPVKMDLGESGSGGSSQRALIGQMHQQLDELLASREKTEHLLRSIINIGSDLDLNATLHLIVATAMELTGARYGALAVHGAHGAWTQFVHAGMDPETIRRIGHLPVGKGVFGVPLDQTPAQRLDDLTTHPAAVGFPEHHPPMRAFLAVPITIRGTVVASLYLTDDRPSRAFAVSDEVAARTFASAAAVAIDNAQLFNAPVSLRSGRTPAAKSSPHCYRVSTHTCGRCS